MAALPSAPRPPDDPIARRLPWLREWFVVPESARPRLGAPGDAILAELADRWDAPGKLELLDALARWFGRAAVAAALEAVVAANIRRDGAAAARGRSARGPADIARVVWDPLPAQGFEFTAERGAECVRIRCTRCPHAELGRETGGSAWLFHLVCSGDGPMTEGFNPALAFHRTQTLMQGHSCCDHTYSLSA